MNHTITLTPKLNVPAPEAPPKRTLSGAFASKLATWIEKSPGHAIIKACIRIAVVLIIAALMFVPELTKATLIFLIEWNHYRIPQFVMVVAFVFNAKRMFMGLRKVKIRQRSKGNQYTLHGVAVPELADFLIENQGFKVDDAIAKLAMPQRQYTALAELLEQNSILIRGEKNARVLNEITRTMLVEQLRALSQGKATPFVWSAERTCWAERNGSFENWAMAHDFKQRKIKEEIEKKERKLERLEKKIGHSAALADLFSKTA